MASWPRGGGCCSRHRWRGGLHLPEGAALSPGRGRGGERDPQGRPLHRPADRDDGPTSPRRRRGRSLSAHPRSLDRDQRRAAEITDGALLILAGPGAGKTRTLTHRIAHLIAERDVAPEHCLAVTFTRRAAGEMRERLTQMLGARGARSRSTPSIRSACRSCARIRRPRACSAISASPARRSASRCSRERWMSPKARPRRCCARSPGRSACRGRRARYRRSPAAYASAMAARNWIDFDDLRRPRAARAVGRSACAALPRTIPFRLGR